MKIRRRNNSGFSLVELMIAIGIISIILAIAVPNLQRWLPAYRLKGATQDMLGNLNRAKLEAIKRNTLCTVMFGGDGDVFDYIVFVDDDGDLEHDAGEAAIATVRLEDYQSVNLDSVDFTDNDDGKKAIAFRPNGLIRDNDGPIEYDPVIDEFKIVFSNTNGTVKTVVISKVGNARIEM